MEPAKISQASQERVNSINNALKILNDAAAESADDIRALANRDYQNLKQILTEAPTAESQTSFLGLENVSRPNFERIRERVVETTKEASQRVNDQAHENPWVFIGVTAALTAVTGFLLGRRIGRS